LCTPLITIACVATTTTTTTSTTIKELASGSVSLLEQSKRIRDISAFALCETSNFF